MAMDNAHLIEDLEFEVRFASRQGAMQSEERLNRCLRERALDAIEQALADVEALIASSKGTIGWRPPRLKAASSREPEAPADILRARDATRQFSQANRIASFTSLTGNHEKTAPRDPEADVFPPPAAAC